MVANGMSSTCVLHPSVHWAQRKNLVFLTVDVTDVTKPEVKIEGSRVYFKGTRSSDNKVFEADMTLYGDVDPDTSKQQLSARNVQLMLMKKEVGPFWPRLLKDSAKCHWLKVDFGKWKDEDESGDEAGAGDGNGMDMDAMMRQMGGLSGLGGGMGGMGGMGGEKPGMDDLGDMDGDSDDEDLPDLED